MALRRSGCFVLEKGAEGAEEAWGEGPRVRIQTLSRCEEPLLHAGPLPSQSEHEGFQLPSVPQSSPFPPFIHAALPSLSSLRTFALGVRRRAGWFDTRLLLLLFLLRQFLGATAADGCGAAGAAAATDGGAFKAHGEGVRLTCRWTQIRWKCRQAVRSEAALGQGREAGSVHEQEGVLEA